MGTCSKTLTGTSGTCFPPSRIHVVQEVHRGFDYAIQPSVCHHLHVSARTGGIDCALDSLDAEDVENRPAGQ